MSYGFDMGFAQANSLQEAMAIALEYTQSQMTEKNIRQWPDFSFIARRKLLRL